MDDDEDGVVFETRPAPDVARYLRRAEAIRALSWRESYAASLADLGRTALSDLELTGCEWRIEFRGRFRGRAGGPRVFPCHFHDDGCYEDSVYFHRYESPCHWGLRGSVVEISVGQGHAISRRPDGGYTIANQVVTVSAARWRKPRVGGAAAVRLEGRRELNGVACVLEAYDAERRRYAARFDERRGAPPTIDARGRILRTGVTAWIKPDNVRLPAKCTVRGRRDGADCEALVLDDDGRGPDFAVVFDSGAIATVARASWVAAVLLDEY